MGRRLVHRLVGAGHDVSVLSRNPERVRSRLPGPVEVIAWDGGKHRASGAMLEALRRAEAVVHLAGESIAGRWTQSKRAEIRRSRVEGTRALVQALAESDARPQTLVSMSAIGYYGDRGDEELTESSSPGAGFLAQVCQEWEREAFAARELGVRVVTLRTGIVLGSGGGALAPLVTVTKLGLGGQLGSGRQWWSWIHVEDLVSLIEQAILGPKAAAFAGPVNAVAPNPVRQHEVARTLGGILRRPALFPAPGFGLRLVLGEFASELLSSRRVLPARALELGFDFRFATLKTALRDLLGNGP